MRIRDDRAHDEPRNQPDSVDRRHPGADHLFRDHDHLRRAFHPASCNCPTRKANRSADQTKSLSVLINAEGRYFVGDQEVLRTDIDALKQALAAAGGSDRNRPVLLRADARTRIRR